MLVRNGQGVSTMPKVETRKAQMELARGQGEYWTQQEQSSLVDTSEEARDGGLDLIFQREPKEIQSKLVDLLIKYNARMEYVPLKVARIKGQTCSKWTC